MFLLQSNWTSARILYLFLLFTQSIQSTASAGILHVPEDYSTIQSAINAAGDGDTVLIADGTYAGPGNFILDFNGKDIKVSGASGDPSRCIINCRGDGRGFSFHHGEGHDSIVTGLTIKDGESDVGGGGIYCYASSPTFINCIIALNEARVGGGLYAFESNPRFINCVFTRNAAVGLYAMGGAVYNSSFSNTEFIGCSFTYNTAPHYGGGMYSTHSNPQLTNCVFSGNSAGTSSGSMYCYMSHPVLTNCILWGNDPGEIVAYDDNSYPVVTYSNVQNGTGEPWFGIGCIEADPLFVDPDGEDDSPYTWNDNNFHILPGSPCIDAGTNSIPVHDVTEALYDPDGNIRPLDGNGDGKAVADIGMDEFDLADLWIQANPPEVTMTIPINSQDPVIPIVTISKTGGDTLHWQITGQPEWLTTTPSNGQSDGEENDVILQIDISSLTSGVYDTELIITDPTAVNSPLVLPVHLHLNHRLEVPFGYSTIQAAINAASDGDEIVLKEGIYTGTGNTNLDFGGRAIMLRSDPSDPALCIIDCQGSGRGFYFHNNEGPDSIIEGLTVINGNVSNHSTGGGSGGGVYCDHANPTIINCLFSGNSASRYGGGVANSYSDTSLINCQFSGNSAKWGGGVSCFSSDPVLTNCTFSSNSASTGGGIANYSASSPSLLNCILWNNGDELYSGDSLVNVSHCCIRGGYPGLGNISRNPLFEDAHGQDGIPGTIDDDLRLSEGSPCNGAGKNTHLPEDLTDMDRDGNTLEPVPFDSSGLPRYIETIDMGACEHPIPTGPTEIPGRLFVDDDAASGGDGSSWPSAFRFLQDALDVADSGTEIWVASGVYFPDRCEADPAGSGNREDSFWIADGIQLYGGFVGTETSLSQRPSDPSLQSIDPASDSILSGNIGTQGSVTDNSENIIQTRYAGSSTILNGFTTTQGYGYAGAGMRNSHSNISIVRCAIIANSVTGTSCAGGGMHNTGGNPSLTNCLIAGNTSAKNGGAFFNQSGSAPLLSNCLIVGNSAETGAAIYSSASHVILSTCTIASNTASVAGGGVFNDEYSNPVVSNSILWGDSPDEITITTGTPSVTYSTVQGGSTQSWFGSGCIDSDPMWIDPDGIDGNLFTWVDNNYQLSPGSPCIDAGENLAVANDASDLDGDGDTDEPIPYDFAGSPRFVDDPDTTDTGSGLPPLVDMGALEYQALPQIDFDDDGDVDLDDFTIFADCYSGPDITIPPTGVEQSTFDQADLDQDKDVDLADFSLFQRLF